MPGHYKEILPAQQLIRTRVLLQPYNEVVYVGFVDQEKALKSKNFGFFERIMGLGNLGF